MFTRNRIVAQGEIAFIATAKNRVVGDEAHLFGFLTEFALNQQYRHASYVCRRIRKHKVTLTPHDENLPNTYVTHTSPVAAGVIHLWVEIIGQYRLLHYRDLNARVVAQCGPRVPDVL